jgi:hypothetical protein
LKLVSVHIPKTAGSSFRKALEIAYGESNFIRLDNNPSWEGSVSVNRRRYTLNKLPVGTEVVHGHFNVVKLQDKLPELNGLPIVTWVRHPVERVISNYYYLEKRLKGKLGKEGDNVNILRKMQRSLLEYVRDEINQNNQCMFLEGTPLEGFDFVGIQEYYAEDLLELGERMMWRKVEEVRSNVTVKPVVSEEIRAEIALLNAGDMALYERALHLRARRKEKPRIELISIHMPKTAGTSFYKTLREVYGPTVSIPIRRGDLAVTIERFGSLEGSLTGERKVVHGHLYYPEIMDLQQQHGAKVITWLRNPVDRVISNYRFFKAGLVWPYRGLKKNESLETYAKKEETRNTMSKFLSGIEVEDLYFVGIQEHYSEDLERLGKLLGWPAISSPVHLNCSVPVKGEVDYSDPVLRRMIAELNQKDIMLYEKALERRKREMSV